MKAMGQVFDPSLIDRTLSRVELERAVGRLDSWQQARLLIYEKSGSLQNLSLVGIHVDGSCLFTICAIDKLDMVVSPAVWTTERIRLEGPEEEPWLALQCPHWQRAVWDDGRSANM